MESRTNLYEDDGLGRSTAAARTRGLLTIVVLLVAALVVHAAAGPVLGVFERLAGKLNGF